MSKGKEKILAALEDVQERIQNLPLERLEADAWTAWQRFNTSQTYPYQPDEQEAAFESFEADWKSGDLFPLLVWSWLASKYGAIETKEMKGGNE